MAKPDAVRSRKDPKIGTTSGRDGEIGKSNFSKLVLSGDPAD
jgi:hypothetical protein